jgi:Protein of unknown function (DUF3618)
MPARGGEVARDPDTIQREIEQARDALASTLDQLGNQASPKRLMDNARASALNTLDNPKVKYPLIGLGVLILLLFLRRLVR